MGNKNFSNNPFFNIQPGGSGLVDTPEEAYKGNDIQNNSIQEKKKAVSGDIKVILELIEDDDFSKLDHINAVRVRRYYSIHQIKVPQQLEDLYQEAILSEGISRSSPIEDYVYDKIHLSFPDAIQSSWLDGFEIDILIPSLNIIVEVDGSYKRHKRRKENREKNAIQKDAYMKQSYGYDTLRFHSEQDVLDQNTNKLIEYLQRF